jgi:hypothetical protein
MPLRSRVTAIACAAIVGHFSLAAVGAGPPEIVRVRVPAGKVQKVFPPGSELRVLTVPEFERLVLEATRQVARPTTPTRLLRARHAARWEAGVLTGRTEFAVEAAVGRSPLLVLEPWTPAIDPASPDAAFVRGLPEGKTALFIPPGADRTVTLAWQLRARPGTEGRVFALGLAGAATGALTLELPTELIPVARAVIRLGPERASGRALWTFHGLEGALDLRLRPASEPAGADQTDPHGWIEGTTRVEVVDGIANWRADWTVHRTGMGSLAVELDPELEPLDVSGPGVSGFAIERAEGRQRLRLRWDERAANDHTQVVIRAIVRVPDDGSWAVPAARPQGAVWTGGRTLVRIGPNRVLEECRERAGLRVAPRPGDEDDPTRPGVLLAFEGTAPRSVAELTFRKPSLDAFAEVRGRLVLGPDMHRLEADIAWTVIRGRLLDLLVDLPSPWSPEHVGFAGSSGSSSWQAEVRPGGGTRIHVHLPPASSRTESVTVRLSAALRGLPASDELALPHVIPVGVRVADEQWAADVVGETTIRPLDGEGLTWVEPVRVGLATAEAQRRELAWRWTRADGRGRLRVAARPRKARAHVVEQVHVSPERVAIDGRVLVDLGVPPLRTIHIVASQAPPGEVEWRFGDGRSAPLPRPLAVLADVRSSPRTGQGAAAWEFDVGGMARALVDLRFHLEVARHPRTAVAVLGVPDPVDTEGTVIVFADRGMHTAIESGGWLRLDTDLALAEEPRETGAQAPGPRAPRTADALGYRGMPPPLVLSSESLLPVAAHALVVESIDSVARMGSSPSHHRLDLLIMSAGSPTLDFGLPRGMFLEQVLLEGRPIPVVDRGRSLAVPLATRRGEQRVRLDYRAAANTDGTAPELPEFAAPCLSFRRVELPASPAERVGTMPLSSQFAPFGRWGELRGVARSERPRALGEIPGWPEAKRRPREWQAALEHPATGWCLGVTLLASGIMARRLSAVTRCRLATVVIALALGAAAWSASPAPLITGALAGTLATVAFWVGSALGGRSAVQSIASSSRQQIGLAGTAAVALASVLAGFAARGADGVTGAWILAVFPDTDDPTAIPRVILRLADYELLRTMARPAPASESSVTTTGASHVVRWTGAAAATIDSRYELDTQCAEAAPWLFPLGGARDWSARLDHQAVAVRVEPGGRSGAILIAGAGAHTVELTRTLTLERDEAAERFSMLVPALATARLRVEPTPSSLRVELPTARGPSRAGGGRVDALLGPTDRLDVLRAAADATARPAAAGSAEGVMLWDAQPAGDRVRARLTYRGPARTRFRVRLEPGLAVLGAAAPGLVATLSAGTGDRPEWLGVLADPQPAGGQLVLDLWRPLPSRGAADDSARQVPRLEPIDVETFSASLALRRPLDWTGRLRADAGADPLTDDGFVSLWGTLPPGDAVMAGAIRFAVPPKLNVPLGPAPARGSASPRLAIDIQPGRLVIAATTELADVDTRNSEMTVVLPPDFRLVRVAGAGLTSWSRTSDRLRLRFDGQESARRTMQVEGWIPVEADPFKSDDARREVALPWLIPAGVASQPGALSISAQADVPFEVWQGGAIVRAAPPTTSVASGAHTLAYSIERPGDPLRLRWWPDPSRSQVDVRSLLVVHPGIAEWTAALVVRPTRGPAEGLTLRLPSDWARAARLELDGAPPGRETESRGNETIWRIKLSEPCWGEQRLVVHCARPLPSRGSVEFPDLVPLGRGTVETRLGVMNRSGAPISFAGSAGIQPIEASRHFIGLDLVDRPVDAAYRVLREGWTLTLTPAASTDRETIAATRASWAETDCRIAEDGRVWGVSRYEIEPRSGSFVSIRAGASLEPLGATVGGTAAPVYRGRSGRLVVPLADSGAARVEFAWRTKLRSGGPERGWLLNLPVADIAGPRPELTVAGPEGWLIEPIPGQTQLTSPAAQLVERAEWRARRVLARAESMERGSPAARAGLLGELVQFENEARAVERAAVSSPNAVPGELDSGLVRERARGARATIDEALRAAGLDEFTRSAAARVGRAGVDPLAEVAVSDASPNALSIPLAGRLTSLRTDAAAAIGPMVRLHEPRHLQFWARPQVWSSVLAGLAALAALLASPRVVAAGGRLGFVLMLLAALALGPFALLLALVMAAAGRFRLGL